MKHENAWMKKKQREALDALTDAHPGAVAEVSHALKADLSDEPGHVQGYITDSGRNHGGFYFRVRVLYIQYGLASDVSERVDGECVPAGDMTPGDIHPAAVSTHVELIYREGRSAEDHRERVERYITERWDPRFPERERVSEGEGGE